MVELSKVIPLSERVRAYFTAKEEGNLRRGPQGAAGRALLQRRLGLTSLVGMEQVHGTALAWAKPQTEPQADGLLVAEPGVGALARGADCLLAALAGNGAAAALHLGWRSLAGGLLERAIEALQRMGEGELVLALGPGAGGCCYEVGPEVAAALGLPARTQRVDLAAVAAGRARQAGVGRVLLLGACTICDERLFSYRREGAEAGRQGVVVWLTS